MQTYKPRYIPIYQYMPACKCALHTYRHANIHARMHNHACRYTLQTWLHVCQLSTYIGYTTYDTCIHDICSSHTFLHTYAHYMCTFM